MRNPTLLLSLIVATVTSTTTILPVNAHSDAKVQGHGHGHGLLSIRSSPPSILTARQVNGDNNSVDQFPDECIDKCTPYVKVGAKCAAVNGNAASEADIMKCACTAELINGMIDCINCAPSTFSSQSDYTPKQIVDMAVAQCAQAGYPITGKINDDTLATTAPKSDPSSSASGDDDDDDEGTSSASGRVASSGASTILTSASRQIGGGPSTTTAAPRSGGQQQSTTTTGSAVTTTTSGAPGGTGAASSTVTMDHTVLVGVLAGAMALSCVLLA